MPQTKNRRQARRVADWEITPLSDRGVIALELFDRTETVGRFIVPAVMAKQLGRDLTKGAEKKRVIRVAQSK